MVFIGSLEDPGFAGQRATDSERRYVSQGVCMEIVGEGCVCVSLSLLVEDSRGRRAV